MEQVRQYQLVFRTRHTPTGMDRFFVLHRYINGECEAWQEFPAEDVSTDEDKLTRARVFLQERGERIIGISRGPASGFTIFTEPVDAAQAKLLDALAERLYRTLLDESGFEPEVAKKVAGDVFGALKETRAELAGHGAGEGNHGPA